MLTIKSPIHGIALIRLVILLLPIFNKVVVRFLLSSLQLRVKAEES